MARLTATNFTGPLQFPYATAGSDLFKKEDVQTMALAVDQHDHSTGKGLKVSATGLTWPQTFPNNATMDGPVANQYRVVFNREVLISGAAPTQPPSLFLGITPAVLKTTAANANILSLESGAGYAYMSGNSHVGISTNLRHDGNGWVFWNSGSPSGLLSVASDAGLFYQTAAAGSTTLTTRFNVDINGRGYFSGNMVINGVRGANQADILFQAGTSGSAGDVHQFAENGNMYFWINNATGGIVVQQQGGVKWLPVSCGAVVTNNFDVTLGTGILRSSGSTAIQVSGLIWTTGPILAGYNSNNGYYLADSGGNSKGFAWMDSGSQIVLNAGPGGTLRVVNNANSVQFNHADVSGFFVDSGLLQVATTLTTLGGGTSQLGGALTLNGTRGTNQGSINFRSSGASTNDGSIFAEGTNMYHWYNGTAMFQGQGGSGWKPIAASAFNINSSVDDKTNITPLVDPLTVVLDERLHGVSYTDVFSEQETIGFVADAWNLVVPSIVAKDDGGKVMAMDYARVGAITFEALKQYVTKTDARLDALEARAA